MAAPLDHINVHLREGTILPTQVRPEEALIHPSLPPPPAILDKLLGAEGSPGKGARKQPIISPSIGPQSLDLKEDLLSVSPRVLNVSC